MARDGSRTGGRQKGTPNKTTKQIKSMVTEFISLNWNQVQKDFRSRRLHPKDRLFFLEKLLKYAVPVMASTSGILDIKKNLEALTDEDLGKVVNMIIDRQSENEGDL